MSVVLDTTLMRIYVQQSERTRGKPAHVAIVEALRTSGIRGAIVFKGFKGFGERRRISSADTVDAYVDFPLLIEVIDEDERIAAFLPLLDALLADGLVTMERLQVAHFHTRAPGA